jgi:hypothetical protein
MDPTRIVLAACWVSLMLIYLLGDVMRIFAGHFTAGGMGDGKPTADWMWTVATLVMLIPVAMILVSLLVPTPALVWVTVIAAAFMAIFNLLGLPYQGFYDNLLIVVGIALNGVTIWQALAWRPAVIG